MRAPTWLTHLRLDTVHTQQTAYALQTLNNIRSHLHSYILFSLATGHPYLSQPIPHLCDYLVFLSHSLSYGTIRNYVSSLQIFFELHHIHVDLFHDFYISLTLSGIKRLHGSSPSAKLPITPQLLVKLHSTINFASTLELVFWTACLLAFFTFFRKSNLFPSSSHQFDPARTLMRMDIQIISSFALVTVNWTKTIQFGERTLSITIPRIPGSVLCPFNALETYFHRVPVPISHCLPLLSTRLVLPFSRLHIPLLFSSFVINSHLLACHPIYILVIVFDVEELHLPLPFIYLMNLFSNKGTENLMHIYVIWTNH